MKNVSVGMACTGSGRLHLGHPCLDVLVRQDLGEVRGRLTRLTGEVAGDDRLARLGDLGVAAGVIGVHVRVDDPADRLVAGELADLGDQLVGQSASVIVSTTSTPSSPIWTAALTPPP